jgi:outer membrane protein
MSRFVFRSAFAPAVLACAVAFLAPALASAELKVGVINFQRALLSTGEMKKASADLAAKYKPKQDQLAKLQQEMADIQARLQDPKTPPGSATDLQLEGQRRQREATRITEDVQAEAEKDRNEVLQRAAQRMTDVVKKLADDKGLDVVVDVANTVFFKPALEVTEEAIAAYDKTYPAK